MFGCSSSVNEKPKKLNIAESQKWQADLEFVLEIINYETKNYKYINDSVCEIDVDFIHPFLDVPVRYKYEIRFDNNDFYDSVFSKKIVKKQVLVDGKYKQAITEFISKEGSGTMADY